MAISSAALAFDEEPTAARIPLTQSVSVVPGKVGEVLPPKIDRMLSQVEVRKSEKLEFEDLKDLQEMKEVDA